MFENVELLVIVGDTDRLTPREQSDEIVRRVPGAEYVVVPDSGHMLTLEKPEVVDAHLIVLLERVRRDIARGRTERRRVTLALARDRRADGGRHAGSRCRARRRAARAAT